ncbi:MAG: hypothetical protein JWO45_415 [Spartobacteria bacterium]|nr:hypothetical protein [Spartobacteria bacterium]
MEIPLKVMKLAADVLDLIPQTAAIVMMFTAPKFVVDTVDLTPNMLILAAQAPACVIGLKFTAHVSKHPINVIHFVVETPAVRFVVACGGRIVAFILAVV